MLYGSAEEEEPLSREDDQGEFMEAVVGQSGFKDEQGFNWSMGKTLQSEENAQAQREKQKCSTFLKVRVKHL